MHTPKAGGSSFKILLEDHYNKSFLADYDDLPINKTLDERTRNAEKFNRKFKAYNKYIYKYKKVDCIHGHFLPFKYSSLLGKKDVFFITWLREPIERMASHYLYWNRTFSKNTKAALHKRVVIENWTFEQFCLSDEISNMYSKFLWKFPIQKFDFIGIAEDYEEDIKYFSRKYLNVDIKEVPKVNVNPNKTSIDITSSDLIDKIKKANYKDYDLYKFALDKKRKRELL